VIAAKHIKFLSFSFAVLSAILALFSLLFLFLRPGQIVITARDKKCALKALPLSFSLPKENYEKIGPPFLNLDYTPPTLEVPDLRQIITFYGTNARPDALLARAISQLLFGLWPKQKRTRL
jgi:hypothetical protein